MLSSKLSGFRKAPGCRIACTIRARSGGRAGGRPSAHLDTIDNRVLSRRSLTSTSLGTLSAGLASSRRAASAVSISLTASTVELSSGCSGRPHLLSLYMACARCVCARAVNHSMIIPGPGMTRATASARVMSPTERSKPRWNALHLAGAYGGALIVL